MNERPLPQAGVSKSCLFLLDKGARSPSSPSERGSQPAAHTGTQRPPAKPLAGLNPSILSVSQSRQGAAGWGESWGSDWADRLHGSWTELLLAAPREIDRLITASGLWSDYRCHCCCCCSIYLSDRCGPSPVVMHSKNNTTIPRCVILSLFIPSVW